MTARNVSATTVGATAAIGLDLTLFKWGVGILVTIPPGTTANYTVQVSGDNNLVPATGTFANWNNHDVLVNQTASANSNLEFPCTGIRLFLNSINGPGPVFMAVVWVTV